VDERVYWVAFSRVRGIGPARVQALLNHFDTLSAAWQADQWELARVGELDRRTLQNLLEARRTIDPQAEVERLTALKIEALTWDDPDYPTQLREIPAAPPVLYLQGEILPADELAVAVVGTRRATSYGEAVTRRLVADLVAAGVTIVSGLALGIDTIAHETALQGNGRTIAVMGCGLDHMYPARNHNLAKRVVARGALVSDYPLGTPPDGPNFPPRNRIISGLSRGTLVIEANEQSGSLITAAFAMEQGREVMAVPGSILVPGCRGTNRLIRDGAIPVLGVDDILGALDLSHAAPQREVREVLPADPTEARVLAQLSADPCHIDDLGRLIAMGASELSSTLTILELKGLVRRVGAMSYIRA
jgi:DNA processing protein